MTRTRKVAAAVLSVVALSITAAPAFAVGGPNEAGNSGHFHPKSNPCDGKNNHPNCPGRH
jgi:hypothetical protein